MAEENRSITVALLAVPEVTASTLYGMVDMLSSAGRDWGFLTRGEAGTQRMHTRVVSSRPEGFLASNKYGYGPIALSKNAPSPTSSAYPTSS